MNEMQVFDNPEFGKIRTVAIDGEPWLVGKDVAAALGYGEGKSLANAIAKHVDAEDKGVTKMMTPGGAQDMIIINESGLYSLVLSSKLPEAKKFKRWVTSEVLPSIRKHGAYMTPETLENMISSPEFGIRLLTALKEEREKSAKLETENQAMAAKAEADRPKVLFADAVSASNTSILVGELAKILKQNGVEMGQNRLFAWLRENGYLIRRQGADHNLPTQRAMELDLFQVKETAITHSDGHVSVSKTVKVTGKGQSYFVNIFLKNRESEIDEAAG